MPPSRFAPTLEKCAAERLEAEGGFRFEFEEVESTAGARAAVEARRAAGWEFVPPVAGVGVVAWLTFRRAR